MTDGPVLQHWTVYVLTWAVLKSITTDAMVRLP